MPKEPVLDIIAQAIRLWPAILPEDTENELHSSDGQ
jgi:hypothetical protein